MFNSIETNVRAKVISCRKFPRGALYTKGVFWLQIACGSVEVCIRFCEGFEMECYLIQGSYAVFYLACYEGI